MSPVSLEDVQRARDAIAGVIVPTPLLPGLGFDVPNHNQLWLKAENLQRTGSFKLRGAANAVANLSPKERERGVITYSSGNHGQAVACAAYLAGVPAVVVMPEDAVPVKVAATERWGADVVFAGYTSLDRMERAMQLVAEHGYTVIPPFDDPRIIAGQGTAGIEIIEALPDTDVVVVPTGGGGLLSGIATAVKGLHPHVRVVGVEPAGAADARDSLRSNAIQTWNEINTVADGLRTSRIGELNFSTIRELVDDIVTVEDSEILEAMRLLALQGKIVAEPSGATAPAAVLFGHIPVQDSRVVAVVSGGNVAPERLASTLAP